MTHLDLIREHQREMSQTDPLMSRALIIGVSGNLGSACRRVLHGRNWHVSGFARGVGAIKWESPNNPQPIPMGDSSPSAILEHEAPYDLVVFAQGTTAMRTIYELDEWGWINIRNNNLDTAMRWTTALAHGHLAEEALIVYCSSIQATHPRRGRIAYVVTKAALEGLARAVAVELAPHARAVALRLGQLTEQMQGVQFEPEEAEQLEHRCCTHWIKPEDVARFILGLYVQSSMTGAVLDFDSGSSLNIWP